MQKRSKPRLNRDNIYLGAFLGLILPLIVGVLFWVFAFSDAYSLVEYWNRLFDKNLVSPILSLSLLINGLLFFYNTSSNHYKTARGVLGITLFYGLLIIIFKFF